MKAPGEKLQKAEKPPLSTFPSFSPGASEKRDESLLDLVAAWQATQPDTPDPALARSLADVFGTLTLEERERLAAETAGGDRLALYVLGELLVVRCASCGGAGWQPATDDDLERCVACGAPAPFTVPTTSEGP